MIRPIPVYSCDDGFYAQKFVKANNMASFPVMSNQFEGQNNFEKIAFLENLRNMATALIYNLQHEQINNPLFYANQFFNSLDHIQPIIPKLDLSKVQRDYLCNDAVETSTNVSSSLQPSSPESNLSPTDNKESVKQKESQSDSESDNSNKGPKTAQSKFKNCYGLVMGKVIKSINEYFKLVCQSKTVEGSQYYYIYQRLCGYSESQKDLFENYLKGYYTRDPSEKKNRGKTTATKFLEQDATQGLILVDIIQSFLESSNPDFQNYISSESNHKKQVSHVLSEEKNLTQLRNTFKEMQSSLEKALQNQTDRKSVV